MHGTFSETESINSSGFLYNLKSSLNSESSVVNFVQTCQRDWRGLRSRGLATPICHALAAGGGMEGHIDISVCVATTGVAGSHGEHTPLGSSLSMHILLLLLVVLMFV